MEFPGFQNEDFELFSIPDFAGRMGEIRARLRPRLAALGEDLAAQIEEVVGSPIYPHVAQHMRRRVNPPAETWVAFARDRKGYKRWTHYRIAVSAAGVRVTLFVEDDADDKPHFGAKLATSAREILAALSPQAPVHWYTLGDAEPVLQAQLHPEALAKAGADLQRLKTLKFQAGVPLPREEALGLSPERFEAWALGQIQLLKPLYVAGLP